ncbi:protein of unknown function [Moritella yayanosii]|uniref:Uncharacterized protein n=1 Tax=Moritella yayanosii TaxID=69539 RepID=A0A330LXZ4_9GAMM|nr:protein of unknown function [Moritella yayanosii]
MAVRVSHFLTDDNGDADLYGHREQLDVKPHLKCHVFSPIEMSLLVLIKDM